MRAPVFIFMAALLALNSGCVLSPGYGSTADNGAAASQPSALPEQGGLSFQPLSVGSPGYSAADHNASFPQTQSQYPLSENARLPSPYDPILRGDRRYSAPFQSSVSPVYSAPIQPSVSPVYSAPVQPSVSPVYSAPIQSSVSPVYSAPAVYSAPGAVPGPSIAGVGGAASSLRLILAADIPPGNHPGDFGPSQWFEIVRPDNGPLRIGRLSTTCVCIGARAPKRQISAGERALIEVRTLSRPPRGGIIYGLFVGVLEPEKLMLDADVAVRF